MESKTARSEPVKPGEAPAVKDQACGTSVSDWLIQASVGMGMATGGPLTKRSGCRARTQAGRTNEFPEPMIIAVGP